MIRNAAEISIGLLGVSFPAKVHSFRYFDYWLVDWGQSLATVSSFLSSLAIIVAHMSVGLVLEDDDLAAYSRNQVAVSSSE